MKRESEAGPEIDLKNLEAREDFLMKRDLKDAEIDPANLSQSLVLTPAEHKLIGSSTHGLAFHPNCPFASLAGSPLEAINQAREQINERSRQGKFHFYLASGREKIINVYPELKPLTKEQIEEQNFLPTFSIIGAGTIRGEKIPTPENVEEKLKKEVEKGQEQTKEMLARGEDLGRMR